MKSTRKVWLYIGIALAAFLALIVIYGVLTFFTLEGKVLDKYTKKPIKDATIELTMRKVKADKNGKFKVSFVRKSYKLKVSKKEFAVRTIVVSGKVAKNHELDVLLRPTTLSGLVMDNMSKQLIKNAIITMRKQKIKSDYKGSYKLKDVPVKAKIVVEPPSEVYEVLEIEVKGTARKNLEISPTPVEAIKRITAFGKHKQYEDHYNFLHPDIKTMVPRDQFIRLQEKIDKELEDTGGAIGEYKIGEVKMLPEWHYEGTNKTYKNVAEIQETITAHFLGMTLPVSQAVHLAKVDGIWRWFMTKENIEEAKKM